jgi:hypothetical protein
LVYGFRGVFSPSWKVGGGAEQLTSWWLGRRKRERKIQRERERRQRDTKRDREKRELEE